MLLNDSVFCNLHQFWHSLRASCKKKFTHSLIKEFSYVLVFTNNVKNIVFILKKKGNFRKISC